MFIGASVAEGPALLHLPTPREPPVGAGGRDWTAPAPPGVV